MPRAFFGLQIGKTNNRKRNHRTYALKSNFFEINLSESKIPAQHQNTLVFA
jgi:hypothetical protein